MLFSYYQTESFNVKPRYECIETKNDVRTSTKYNNEANCTANGGKWLLVYSYIEKAPGKGITPDDNKLQSYFFRCLAYTTQATCERASSSRYQYKWARTYARFLSMKSKKQ